MTRRDFKLQFHAVDLEVLMAFGRVVAVHN